MHSKKILIYTILSLSAFLIIGIIQLIFPDMFNDLENKTYDYRLLLKRNMDISSRIIHIDIDDNSIEKLGKWPWPRKTHGQLIKLLQEYKVKAILYDIIFSRPGEKEDDWFLVEETRRGGNVYYGVGLELIKQKEDFIISQEGDEEKLNALFSHVFSLPGKDEFLKNSYHARRLFAPFFELIEKSKGVGHITATPDHDGVFRRLPLLVDIEDRLFPSLTFKIIRDYWDVEEIFLAPKKIILQNALVSPLQRRDVILPVDNKGEFLINYAATWDKGFKHYSFADIILSQEDKQDREILSRELADKIVIVSLIASGRVNMRPLPIETASSSSIHSNALNTLLTRSFLHYLPGYLNILLNIFLLGLICIFSLSQRPLFLAISTFLLMILYLSIGLLFFNMGIVLKIVSPFFSTGLALLFILVFKYTTEEKEKKRLRLGMQSYLSPQILQKVVDNPEGFSLGGKRKELTILFSDIVGFTSASEQLTAEQLQKLLSKYFEKMSEVAFEYGGTVNKFMGDGMLVFYGDPISFEDAPYRGVATALKMQEEIEELKNDWIELGLDSLKIRVGIHTGEVTVGNMGSKKRMEYTVVGKNVNFAQRLESKAPPGGILISEKTYSYLKDQVEAKKRVIRVKGIEGEQMVYEVIGNRKS